MEPSESDKQTTDKSSNGSNEKAWEVFQKIDGSQQEFKTDENGKPQYFDVCATSFEEAVGIFAIETGLPYGSITNIFEE